jgi:Tfp pilus assembly protein PilF
MKEEARNAFQTALKFDPNYAEAHFELAKLYLAGFDDNRSATRHFRQYLALKPTAEDAERVKGWLLKTEKELNADKERQGWGKRGLGRGLQRIFE